MTGIKARVKRLCNTMEQPISVMKLEEILGFANGTIGKWDKATRIPYGRVVAVAEYLHTTPEYIINGDEGSKEKTEAPEGAPDDVAKFALFGGDADQISDEAYEEVKKFAAYVKQREKEKKG